MHPNLNMLGIKVVWLIIQIDGVKLGVSTRVFTKYFQNSDKANSKKH